MIKLINISKKYKDKIVLSNFNYTFNDIGLYYLIGKSGSGKTTLLNLISGIIDATSGYIEYDNIDSIYKDVYYIYQDFNLFTNLTVIENIIMVFKIKNNTIDYKRIDEELLRFGLSEFKNRKSSTLSGGERQRLSILIGVLLNSKVIILDEPTASLDEDNSKIIFDLIKEISKEKLVIVSTHNKRYINDDDIVINLENIQNEANIIVEDNKNSCQKKINLKKNIFFIKNKLMRRQIVRCITQILILTTLILTSTFIIPLNNMTEISMASNHIINDEQYIIAENKKLNLSGYDYLEGAISYVKIADSDGTFMNFVDDSLSDDEIVIGSSVANTLINSNYFDSYDDAINKYINIEGYEFKIIKVVENKDSWPTSLDIYRFISTNSRMFKKIDYKGSDVIDYKYHVDKSLPDNSIILSKNYDKSALKDKNIGDKISIVFKDYNIEMTYDFTIVGFDDKCYIDSTSASCIMYKFAQHDQIFIKNLTDYNKTYKLYNLLKENKINFDYNHSFSVYRVADQFKAFNYLFRVLIPVGIIFELIISLYMIYSIFKENNRNFDSLRLLGVSKIGIYKLCLIDELECILLSIVLSIYPIFLFNKYLIDGAVKHGGDELQISLTIFKPEYLIFSIVATSFIFTVISFIVVMLRNKKTSYIN